MIQDLQKRPFARPLLMWIAGVVWQTCFPVSPFLLGFWLLPAAVLLFASAVLAGRKAHFSFGARWLWGAAVLPIFMFLAMQKTACSQLCMTHTIVPETLLQLAEATQQHLLTPVDKLHLTGEEKSVFATLTLGARERMERDVTARFSVTGAVHILSVSGFHVAIVCSFLTLLLSFLPRGGWGDWTRYGLSVGLLWAFVFVTGLEAASIRSALMLTLYLTGRRLNRNTDSYNIWAASAFCMLAYEPFYLFDIGFQLSYLAVWSILYFQPRMQGWFPTRNPFFQNDWRRHYSDTRGTGGNDLSVPLLLRSILYGFPFDQPASHFSLFDTDSRRLALAFTSGIASRLCSFAICSREIDPRALWCGRYV